MAPPIKAHSIIPVQQDPFTEDGDELFVQTASGDRVSWNPLTGERTEYDDQHFFARRDPTDNRWYFFDPYGIYALPSCYPAGMTDSLNISCVRYPVAWKGGKQHASHRGRVRRQPRSSTI